MRRSALALLAMVLCHATVGSAQPLPAQQGAIPPELKPWESWVLYGEEFRRCPLQDGLAADTEAAFVCAWPGRMRVAVSSGGGEFRQSWRLYAERWVALPGDRERWPEDVRVDGKPAPAVERDGIPQLRLAAGDHTVSGSFTWSRRPESLQLPAATALVDLTIDGRAIAPVELRAGRLWLGAVRTVTVPRALQVQVYRLLQDDIPLQLTTRLQLKVAGDAREEVLARVLPDGFVPTATSGELPMRFEPDGRLRVQVRSGEHQLTVIARAAPSGTAITVPQGEGTWADEEVWSYGGNDRLRITALEGASPIDPIQAGVPEDWRSQSAFRLPRGASVTIAERSRGLSSADAHRLSLQRELWLTFDHQDFIAADRISGTMQQRWRLDMLAPYRLLNARHDAEMLLITDGAEGRTGVEVRNTNVNLTTLARVPRTDAHAATGWDARFDSVQTTLHLPPGHRLLAAWGADDAPQAWVNQWRLLDLFLLMLAAAAAYRLLGWGGAALAASVILLTHQESGAPGWLWINLFVAVALLRFVPEGRLRKWVSRYQFVSLAALAFVLIAFGVQQYRQALHPQLMQYGRVSSGQAFGLQQAPVTLDMGIPAAAPPEVALESTVVTGSRVPQVAFNSAPAVDEVSRAKRLDRYAPDATLQTGPGIPNWSYLNYSLQWSGPVTEKQTVRLTIVPPWLLSVWRIAGLLVAAALLLAIVRLAYGVPRDWRLPPWRSSAAAVLVLAMLASGFAPRAHAQSPDPSVLAELKKRLSEPAKCVPKCVEAVMATVSVGGDRLDVQMEVHSQASVVLGIPQAGPQWIIERVSIDDRAEDAVARVGDRMQVPLTPGVHRIGIAGRIAQADELALEFATVPRRVAVRADGWDATGVSEGRLLNSSLQLTRRVSAGAPERLAASQRFAPFVRIHRRVFMGLDWTVTTSVERLAPEEGAFTLRLPLLPGESVLTPGLQVNAEGVLVSMPSGASTVSWESALERVDRLQWTVAGSDQPWVERWEVVVSPTWHAEFSGTPAILPDSSSDGMWINQFLPRPGEALDLVVVRPAASKGDTIAVDTAWLTTTFGERTANSLLNFTYRSSRGGRHDLRLPQDAEVKRVLADNQPVPLRPTDGVLPLTLVPGQHSVTVEFGRDEGVGIASRPPLVDLGAEGTNVNTTLALPRDRWVLFAWGRGVGPAILYWGELALFVVIAVALGRLRRTPLRTRDWLLLGLGLSTFSWWVLIVFGAWLFILDRRPELRIETRWQFNAVQVLLGLLSLVALGVLVSAIPYGLLGEPDMGLRGASVLNMTWFMDRTAAQLPQPVVISVSIWFYKLAMLLWALWLSFALLRWLPWAWRQFASGGVWRGQKAES
ncbi:MAG TPA: hypothetical protein VJQ52_13930 [Steroidobacteraceae bacterium]|nr:hypothetical protein [Steroidobacteraceae bacterium]